MDSTAAPPTVSVLRGTDIEALLRQVGHILDRADGNMQYVLTVVFEKFGERVLGLLKLKGPAMLIGKVTFPGGQLELDEELEFACSRELYEETNVRINAADWTFVCRSNLVAVFAAVAETLTSARTMEVEPVFTMLVDPHLDMAAHRPELYTLDFRAILLASRRVLGLD